MLRWMPPTEAEVARGGFFFPVQPDGAKQPAVWELGTQSVALKTDESVAAPRPHLVHVIVDGESDLT